MDTEWTMAADILGKLCEMLIRLYLSCWAEAAGRAGQHCRNSLPVATSLPLTNGKMGMLDWLCQCTHQWNVEGCRRHSNESPIGSMYVALRPTGQQLLAEQGGAEGCGITQQEGQGRTTARLGNADALVCPCHLELCATLSFRPSILVSGIDPSARRLLQGAALPFQPLLLMVRRESNG